MRDRARRFFSAWAAGALATVGLVPAYIAVITVVLLLAMANGTQISGVAVVDATGRLVTTILGPVLGLATWLGIGLVAMRFTGADQANPVLYADLSGQVAGLRARIDAACPDAGSGGQGGMRSSGDPDPADPTAAGPADHGACDAALAHCSEVERLLGVDGGGTRPATGPSWTTGAGYVGAWQRIHRAEEAMLSIAPASVVVAEAMYDRSRLVGSTIATRVDLMTASVAAVNALTGAAAAAAGDGAANGAPSQGIAPAPALDAAAGRQVIRTIRLAINEFRDGRSAELVRLRRRLTQSNLFTGMTAVILLLLSILAGTPVVAILGGVAYYLIGALVGLLQRIHGELELESSVEDYGLSTARLLLAPLVSGLAAVAGVVLISVVSGRPFGLYLVEPAADPPGTLFDAFSITKYPFGLVVAAAFGLAPGVLLRRLKTVGDSLKTDLESSEAAGSGRQR